MSKQNQVFTVGLVDVTGEEMFAEVVDITSTNIHFKNNGKSEITLVFADGSEMSMGKGFFVTDFRTGDYDEKEEMKKIARWIQKELKLGNSPKAIYNRLSVSKGPYQKFIDSVTNEEGEENLFADKFYELPKVLRNYVAYRIDGESYRLTGKIKGEGAIEFNRDKKDVRGFFWKLVAKIYDHTAEKLAAILAEYGAELMVDEDLCLRVSYWEGNGKFNVRPVEFFTS